MLRTKTMRAAAPLLPLLLLAGCGEDGSDTNATASTAAPVSGETVTVTAQDYEYEGLPATLPAGARLALTNASEKEVHELVAFALPDGETRTAAELFELPQAELEALFAGEPPLVIVAPPSGTGFDAVGDGTLAEPGRYVLFCAIPTGADPDEYLAAAQASEGGPPEVDGGPPHFTGGMFADVTVE